MLGSIRDLPAVFGVPRLSPEELQRLQEAKLRRLVQHAYDRVPFHRRRFEAAGLRPGDIRALDDVRQLPIMDREDLRSDGAERLLASGWKAERCRRLSSSGSTGEPAMVQVGPRDGRLRRLVELRTLRSVGFSPRDRLVAVGPSRPRPRGLHERLGLFRTDLATEVVAEEDGLERLGRLRPTLFWFYPTCLRSLYWKAGGCLRGHLQPRLLISSGERLDDGLRKQVREDLGVEPLDFYGCIEIGRIAAQCPLREGLHINADHVLVEVVRGEVGDLEEGVGSVLLTALNQFATPLIRYRIGDLGRLRRDPCPCGSPFPLMDPPGGREGSVVRLPSGQVVSPLRINHVVARRREILGFQIVQEATDRILILAVTGERLRSDARDEIIAAILDGLGEHVEIELRRVEDIPQRGTKTLSFVSRLTESVAD